MKIKKNIHIILAIIFLLQHIIKSSNTNLMQNSQLSVDLSQKKLQNSQSGGNLCNSSLNKHLLISRTNESFEINNSLKKLHDNLKFQLSYVTNRGQSGSGQINTMKKKEKKLEAQVQHMTTILNILISANNKLKSQVNNSRNSRVIYSTVFKTFQKEIHKQQDSYKMALLETLFLSETSIRIKQKLIKSKKKIEKQIRNIERQISNQATQANQIVIVKESDQIKKRQNNKKVFLNVQQENQSLSNNLSSIKRVKNKSNYQEKDQQALYEEQNRKLKIDNLIKHLKQITGLEDMQEICHLWKSIDQQIQEIYSKYRQLQQRELLTENDIVKKHESLEEEQNKIIQQNCLKETQLKETNEQKIKRLKQNLNKLQSEFTQIVDIKCSNLGPEDILFYAQRFKNRNKSPKYQQKIGKARKNTAISNSGRNRMKNTIKMSNITNQIPEAKNINKILQLAGNNRDEGIYLLSQQQMRKENLKYIVQ